MAKAFHAHGFYPPDIIPPRSTHFASGRFGRLFGRLPPFASDTPQTRQALLDMGKPVGIMDAQDNLAAGPQLLAPLHEEVERRTSVLLGRKVPIVLQNTIGYGGVAGAAGLVFLQQRLLTI